MEGLHFFDELPHDEGHAGLRFGGCLLYLFVRAFDDVAEATQVGDDRDGKDLHAGVVGDDDFGDGRHAYGVTAYRAEVAVLGRRFKRGPLGADVDALLHCNVVAAGYVEGFGDEAGGIGIAHVGESGPEFVVVFPAQRWSGKVLIVVSDEHEVAHP